MMEDRKSEMIAVLIAIDAGWSLVDEKDEDDFMVFVNEARDKKTDFYPKKELLLEMQRCGYLHPIEPMPRQSEERKGIFEPSSILYQFSIAQNGDALLNDCVKLCPEVKRRIGFFA